MIAGNLLAGYSDIKKKKKGKKPEDVYIYRRWIGSICFQQLLITDIQAKIGNTIDIDRCWWWKGIVLLAINDEEIKGTALKV